MNNQDGINNQIIKNIATSNLINQPFDHKFVENIFPSEFYKNLISNIPDKSNYVPIVETGTVGSTYSPERFIFNLLDKKLINKLDSAKQNFFESLVEILISDKLFTSVTSQFSKTIDHRLANLTNEEKKHIGESNYKFTIRVALIKDFTKYSLGVHSDSISKFVTYLFYIPSDDSLNKVGTTLYKQVGDNNFKKIKTCPFIPNSLLVFPRTNISFHGVEELNIEQKERNLLLLNYYIEK